MKFYLAVKQIFKIYKAPLLSGVLFGCSFIPFPFFFWFFCLVPLWFFIYTQNSLKRVLIGCLICQSLATLIGFNWMLLTFHLFGGMNLFVSSILLVLFCIFANTYVLISGVLWFFLSKKISLSVVKLSLFPLLFSSFHSLIPTLFPWDMGYPWLWSGFWGFQTAELWGFRFLNTLFYVFNLLFLIVFYHLKRKPLKSFQKSNVLILFFQKIKSFFLSLYLDKVGLKALACIVILFCFLNGLGFYLKQRLPDFDESLNVIMVQHNINALDAQNFEPYKSPEQKSLAHLTSLTFQALKKAKKNNIKKEDIDIIVWPEGAYPYGIYKKQRRDRRLSKLTRVLGVPIITGGTSTNKDETFGNSIFVFDRRGKLLKPIYDKVKLLIFGEYFPLIDRFDFLRKLFPYFGRTLSAGPSFFAQELEGRRYGWLICYEALFDEISRELAHKKAQVLINLSNDSWYGSWQQPYQHLTISFARAVELRRPLIRATNTGLSGIIFPNGEVQTWSEFGKAWSHLYKVPYYKNPPKTLFMSWGYFINEIFLSFLTLLMFFSILKERFFKKH